MYDSLKKINLKHIILSNISLVRVELCYHMTLTWNKNIFGNRFISMIKNYELSIAIKNTYIHLLDLHSWISRVVINSFITCWWSRIAAFSRCLVVKFKILLLNNIGIIYLSLQVIFILCLYFMRFWYRSRRFIEVGFVKRNQAFDLNFSFTTTQNQGKSFKVKLPLSFIRVEYLSRFTELLFAPI